MNQESIVNNQLSTTLDLIVIGGGAAGFMGAITAAESGVKSIYILEATSKTLEKVRISGGGRCNVTNSCWEPKELARNYPRGEKGLLGPFSRFATGDAIEWFEDKGLKLKIEKDGRIFPKSNSSNDVLNCLRESSKRLGVQHFINTEVQHVEALVKEKGFKIKCRSKDVFFSKKILICTGGAPSGKKIAFQLGHKPIKAIPSLFSFKLDSPWIKKCAGISINDLQLRLECQNKSFEENGRVLLTHWGVSGPTILKLSSFAARHLNNDKYKSKLYINWTNYNNKEIKDLFKRYREAYSKSSIKNTYPFKEIPKRVWINILESINISPSTKWANFSITQENNLKLKLIKDLHLISGRGPFGEEFVTAGGVPLNELHLSSMESRKCKGLYFAGEVINIDGITGGFNLQHCWTSGWLAGKSIGEEILSHKNIY